MICCFIWSKWVSQNGIQAPQFHFDFPHGCVWSVNPENQKLDSGKAIRLEVVIDETLLFDAIEQKYLMEK